MSDWFTMADDCYGRAADRVIALQRALEQELTEGQRKSLKDLLGTQRQRSEIEYLTAFEQALVHWADPARAFRALFDHVLNGGMRDPSACCADRPRLPFEDETEDES